MIRKEDRGVLIYLLDILGKGFDFESREKTILDVASGMRENNWNGASRVVLEVGNELVPESSKIKSQLINDLWAIAAEFGEEESLFEEIIGLLKKIDLAEINPDAREVICYYGLCSLVLLGRTSEIPAYLTDYVYPNVSTSKLKLKITALLGNPRGYRPSDLLIA